MHSSEASVFDRQGCMVCATLMYWTFIKAKDGSSEYTFRCQCCTFERCYAFAASKPHGDMSETATSLPAVISTRSLVSSTLRQLERLIKQKAIRLYGLWPKTMTLLVFDGGSGWNVSISPPQTEAEHFYRNRTYELVMQMFVEFDLDLPTIVP